MPPLTSASIQREADLAAHAPPTLRARLVRRQLPPQTKGRATRQRRSDTKKRLACGMAKRLRYPTHPSDMRSRGLPEQRASLRSALAPFLGKANATRGHCLPGWRCNASRRTVHVQYAHGGKCQIDKSTLNPNTLGLARARRTSKFTTSHDRRIGAAMDPASAITIPLVALHILSAPHVESAATSAMCMSQHTISRAA